MNTLLASSNQPIDGYGPISQYLNDGTTTLIAVGGGEGAPLMLKIIFWLLLILWAIGSFGWHDNPAWVRGSNGLLIVLFAILGYFTFGF